MSPPSRPSEGTHEPLSGGVFACYRDAAPAGARRLMLVGELDLVTALRAETAIRQAQAGARELICDLGDVWFVDLAGLRVLLEATERATSTGGRLTIANCPPIVPRMLRLLKLDGALAIRRPAPSAGPLAGTHARTRRHVS
jgi:anti-anti-sigma factor